jgi:hypothetical protein
MNFSAARLNQGIGPLHNSYAGRCGPALTMRGAEMETGASAVNLDSFQSSSSSTGIWPHARVAVILLSHKELEAEHPMH